MINLARAFKFKVKIFYPSIDILVRWIYNCARTNPHKSDRLTRCLGDVSSRRFVVIFRSLRVFESRERSKVNTFTFTYWYDIKFDWIFKEAELFFKNPLLKEELDYALYIYRRSAEGLKRLNWIMGSNKSHDLLFNGALILLMRVTLIEENVEAWYTRSTGSHHVWSMLRLHLTHVIQSPMFHGNQNYSRVLYYFIWIY